MSTSLLEDPNHAPTRVRPVHVLPPRRYAGEDDGPAPAAGARPSVEALACRQMLREFRLVRRREKLRRWQGGPLGALRGDPAPAAPGADPGNPPKSRYLGVYWFARDRAWRARVSADGRQYHAGQSASQEAAARLHDEMARRMFGRTARLNFPDAAPDVAVDLERAEAEDAEDCPARAERSSRYRGVYWDGANRCWRARIYLRGENHRAGSSKDEERAARMADALAVRLMGDGAILNFPAGREPVMATAGEGVAP